VRVCLLRSLARRLAQTGPRGAERRTLEISNKHYLLSTPIASEIFLKTVFLQEFYEAMVDFADKLRTFKNHAGYKLDK